MNETPLNMYDAANACYYTIDTKFYACGCAQGGDSDFWLRTAPDSIASGTIYSGTAMKLQRKWTL